ncbi:MAG: hypothetical protein ACOC28_06895 [Alkalispirochaetaceae bacterium]
MKASALAAITAGFSLLASIPTLHAQEQIVHPVLITNESGFEILDLFLSPADRPSRSANLIAPNETLRDGEARRYGVHLPGECDDYDLLAVDADGDAYEISGIAICRGEESSIAITLDHIVGPAAERRLRPVRLINRLPFDLHYVFLTPSSAATWGVDYLTPSRVLERGRSLSLLVPESASQEAMELLLVDEKASRYAIALEIEEGERPTEVFVELTDLKEVGR